MRRGNDGGLFCHILETGAIGSHLFDKYRQSSTFFQRQNGLFSPDTSRCFVLHCSLFFPGGEKRTRAKTGNPIGLARCTHPSAELTFPAKNILRGFSFEKPRREKQETDDGGGPPDGLRPNPTPLRFLFFGSFFSFPERKERTGEESENSRRQSSASGAPVCAARRRNSGFCDSMGSPCTHSGRNRSVQRSRLQRGRGGGGDGAAAMKRA